MRQLKQCQRVAARLGEYPIPHAVIEWPTDGRREQLACAVARQPPQRQIRQPGQLVKLARLALGEQQDNRLRQQTPRHEREHLGRGPVQPLGIIDQAQQGPFLGGVRQQAEHRQADQKPVGLRPRIQPKRRRRAHRVAAAAAARGRLASARTTDASRQREAPSPTRPRPPGQPGSPRHAQPRNSAALSFLSPVRRAAPAPRSA